MSIIRSILAVLIRIIDTLFAPKLAKLSPDQESKVRELTKGMEVYQFQSCPFCVKLRWSLLKMGVDLPYKDAKRDQVARKELEQGGGRVKVPCLKYQKDGKEHWMYESNDIKNHFEALLA